MLRKQNPTFLETYAEVVTGEKKLVAMICSQIIRGGWEPAADEVSATMNGWVLCSRATGPPGLMSFSLCLGMFVTPKIKSYQHGHWVVTQRLGFSRSEVGLSDLL